MYQQYQQQPHFGHDNPAYQPQQDTYSPPPPPYSPQAASYPPQPALPRGGGNQPVIVIMSGTGNEAGAGASAGAGDKKPDGGGWLRPEPAGLFMEKAIRQAFISKVYSILTIQLLLTSVMIGVFVLNENIKTYFVAHPEWAFLGLGLFLVAYLVLICSETARRTIPYNLILLDLLTLGYGSAAAIISCFYETQIVLYAFVATGVSCFLIAAFAKSTKLDTTDCGGTLCLLVFAHLIIGSVLVIVLVPMGYANAASLLVGTSGALLASLFLIYDLQLIMGGRKCQLSPEEYVLACAMLYVDIMRIFLQMLRIFRGVSRS